MNFDTLSERLEETQARMEELGLHLASAPREISEAWRPPEEEGINVHTRDDPNSLCVPSHNDYLALPSCAQDHVVS